MKELGIDIETYSGEDLARSGVYRYAESPDFRVLLFAYSVDGAPARVCDVESGEVIPEPIVAALRDPGVRKTAYNAAFERVCLSRHFGWGLMDPAQWDCTMAAAARLGFPLGLGACAAAMRLETRKMSEGAALIRYFSRPRPDGGRRVPADDPERWEAFKAYCARDVDTEQAILRVARRLPVPAWERELYAADQRINDRGALVDMTLARACADMDSRRRAALAAEARAITGLDNPNSPAQLKQWLASELRAPVPALRKTDLADLAGRLPPGSKAARALEIRSELGKTSNAKYAALLACACSDGRARGLLQYYGASRTGRWAGRLVQVQNLPQNHLPDLAAARAIARRGDLDELELCYDRPGEVLSQLIRTAFAAPRGWTLHVCDFSAIEARVTAWLAGEEWVLDVFRAGGDIYCATAEQMFGVRVEKHGPNAWLRQRGKIAALALGYGGGEAALDAMGAGRLGLTDADKRETVRRWRAANPRIARLWAELENAALRAVAEGCEFRLGRGLTVARRWGALTITLPSGRTLVYPRAEIVTDTSGWRPKHAIEHEGVNQATKQWGKLRTYGGKLTENVVQAIARDILAAVLLRAEAAGMRTVFHVHDEIVVEAPPALPLAAVEELFSAAPPWAEGLPLRGAGYSTPYYLKD